MLAVLCSGCLGVIDDFSDLTFDEYANAFHEGCETAVPFDTDLAGDE